MCTVPVWEPNEVAQRVRTASGTILRSSESDSPRRSLSSRAPQRQSPGAATTDLGHKTTWRVSVRGVARCPHDPPQVPYNGGYARADMARICRPASRSCLPLLPLRVCRKRCSEGKNPSNSRVVRAARWVEGDQEFMDVTRSGLITAVGFDRVHNMYPPLPARQPDAPVTRMSAHLICCGSVVGNGRGKSIDESVYCSYIAIWRPYLASTNIFIGISGVRYRMKAVKHSQLRPGAPLTRLLIILLLSDCSNGAPFLTVFTPPLLFPPHSVNKQRGKKCNRFAYPSSTELHERLEPASCRFNGRPVSRLASPAGRRAHISGGGTGRPA